MNPGIRERRRKGGRSRAILPELAGRERAAAGRQGDRRQQLAALLQPEKGELGFELPDADASRCLCPMAAIGA